MKYFLRIAAVLVALGNWFAADDGRRPFAPRELRLGRIAVLRPRPERARAGGRRDLAQAGGEGPTGQLSRPLRRVGGDGVDRGMLCGVALASRGVLRDEALGVIGTLGFSAVASLWGIVCGGVLGLAEGLVLGLPLAALVRSFEKEHQ
jgi:hypothetical protein